MYDDPRWQSLSTTERLLLKVIIHRSLKHGYCFASQSRLAIDIGSTTRTVIRAIKALVDAKLVRVERQQYQLHIYPTCDTSVTTEAEPDVTLKTPDVTPVTVRSDTSVTHNIKKKIKSKKKTLYTDTFEKFWKHYPRKSGKLAASKAFDKLTPEEQEAAIAGAFQYWQSRQNKDPKYTKMAQGWLNDRRWEDEVDPSQLSIRDRIAAEVQQPAIRDITPNDRNHITRLSTPHQPAEIEDSRVLNILRGAAKSR